MARFDRSHRVAASCIDDAIRGGVYVNDLGNDAAERVREVYGSKFERLVSLKQRWDPDNVFHLNANIPPTSA